MTGLRKNCPFDIQLSKDKNICICCWGISFHKSCIEKTSVMESLCTIWEIFVSNLSVLLGRVGGGVKWNLFYSHNRIPYNSVGGGGDERIETSVLGVNWIPF